MKVRSLVKLRNWRNCFLFVRVWWFAAIIPLLLRFNIDRIQKWIEPKVRSTPDPAAFAAKVMQCIAWGQTLTPRLVRRGCLTRGLTLYRFLRGAGLPVQLCFGVGKQGTEYGGHCWLLLDNQPYLENKDPRAMFKEMFRIPADLALPTTNRRGRYVGIRDV